MYNSLEHPGITRVRQYGLPVETTPGESCPRCGARMDEKEAVCENCRRKTVMKFTRVLKGFFEPCEIQCLDEMLDGISVNDLMGKVL